MAKKKSTVGGKREGAGRKPKADSERAVMFAVSVPPQEAESLSQLMADHGLNRSQMVAELIRRAAKRSKKG